MFKFGFTEESTKEDMEDEEITKEDKEDESTKEDEGNDVSGKNVLQWYPALEIFANQQHLETVVSLKTVSKFTCGGLKLPYVPNKNVMKRLAAEDSAIEAEKLHSDLLPAKYEGGFKIWECTHYLAEFLISEAGGVEFSDKLVLDLGCGAGLLGVLALCHGAFVHFQDYNASVLNILTIPNVYLNMATESRQEKITACRFFAGDWGSLVDLLAPEGLQYDYILASETIYNVENYNKLCTLFKRLLSPSGTVYVAAKTYYFGVGGGVREFEAALKEDGTLTSSVCWKCSQGVQHEILKITFPGIPS